MELFIGGEMGPWPKKLDKEIDKHILSIANNTEFPLEEFIKTKNYGPGLIEFGVIPMCIRKDIKLFSERTYYNSKKGEADYRLNIPYDEFVNSDEAGKRRLIIINIITSIRHIGKRAEKLKVEFDSVQMEADIRDFLKFKEKLEI